MKHLVNFALFVMIPFGVVLAEESLMGWVMIIFPFAFWGTKYLSLISKSKYATILLIAGLACVVAYVGHSQLSVALVALSVLVVFLQEAIKALFGAFCGIGEEFSTLPNQEGGRSCSKSEYIPGSDIYGSGIHDPNSGIIKDFVKDDPVQGRYW